MLIRGGILNLLFLALSWKRKRPQLYLHLSAMESNNPQSNWINHNIISVVWRNRSLIDSSADGRGSSCRVCLYSMKLDEWIAHRGTWTWPLPAARPAKIPAVSLCQMAICSVALEQSIPVRNGILSTTGHPARVTDTVRGWGHVLSVAPSIPPPPSWPWLGERNSFMSNNIPTSKRGREFV